MFLVCTAVLIFLTIMRQIENSSFGMGSLRVLMLAVYNLICLGFSRFGFPRVGKYSLFFVAPVIIFVWPTLVGFVEEESFAYYPFLLIIMSFLPQLLMVPVLEKRWVIIGISYYFLLLLVMEPFMMHFMPEEFGIVPIIRRIFPYTKMVQIAMFIFMQYALFYLRRLNFQFEQEVTLTNQMLSEKNRKLNRTLRDLKDTREQLYQLERHSTMGTLTQGMAHEINNPLNYISGGLEMLDEVEDQFNRDILTKAIGIIRQGLDKTVKIVNALLSYTGRGEGKLEEVDLHEVLDNTLLLLRHSFPPQLNIIKSYRLYEKVPVYREKIQKVVISILENAIYAINEKKEPDREEFIRVSTFFETCFLGQCACIAITNSGPPIPEENLAKIFDPFYTTKDPGEGTGLGMAISYMLMKEHEGHISAENTDEGVTFTLRFPLQRATKTGDRLTESSSRN